MEDCKGDEFSNKASLDKGIVKEENESVDTLSNLIIDAHSPEFAWKLADVLKQKVQSDIDKSTAESIRMWAGDDFKDEPFTGSDKERRGIKIHALAHARLQQNGHDKEEAVKWATEKVDCEISELEEKTERNATVISSFIEHCKENGMEIPDTLFESYFNA